MAAIRSYRDLLVWQKGMELAKAIYVLSRPFPKAETFGLTSQMRRAAVSIPSNIAEGYGRHSKADYTRFLNIAMGSLCELQTQLELATALEMANNESATPVMSSTLELERMLSSLIRKLSAIVFLCASVSLSLCPFL